MGGADVGGQVPRSAQQAGAAPPPRRGRPAPKAPKASDGPCTIALSNRNHRRPMHGDHGATDGTPLLLCSLPGPLLEENAFALEV